jgi:hypothetical protein
MPAPLSLDLRRRFERYIADGLTRISHQVARLVRIVGWSGARVHGAHVGMAGFRRRLEFQR